ncbi:alkaline phosphatase PhoX [Aurantiacibacter spongiae]|uniref:DUF839 domain-containing protein n=1 Tax=Aurantiacibacter spongiae TaxID=2488860 RepID=A0A3N5CPP6_9SPHN|nr:alkaline phosphatase PhoX [Aurantiacibacter spongiae]RPF70983.1 DUF839 domain-containing protein [Aurantiacibacter spongiae]
MLQDQNRRRFLQATGSAFAALAASGCMRVPVRSAAAPGAAPTTTLVPDPAGILDLPPGFSYRVLSRLDDEMSDGNRVPDRADGMGCFDLGGGKLALVRNHELSPQHDNGGVSGKAYDTVARSLVPLPGGTTTIVLDAHTLEVERVYRSLAGTIRNCAGGITPWGSWLSCEENTDRANGRINKDHGYVFEVPADAGGLVDPVPLREMGRFNHEAACVDPATGVVYMTEDKQDSLFYRFIPAVPGQLARGGRLQALMLNGVDDTSNRESVQVQVGQPVAGRWIDLDNVESPEDDLRQRGHAQGAAIIARGEGIWMGDGEMYFTATSGGAAEEGQIFRFRPSTDELTLFFESTDIAQYSYGDNLCVAPSGHLVVCEDQYTDTVDNHLRGITPSGQSYDLGRIRIQTEPAGVSFSPDGRTMFMNIYSPAMTLAIRGPWQDLWNG